ncbi:hypothetical protein ES703_110052 [subsurface metagenome]
MPITCRPAPTAKSISVLAGEREIIRWGGLLTVTARFRPSVIVTGKSIFGIEPVVSGAGRPSCSTAPPLKQSVLARIMTRNDKIISRMNLEIIKPPWISTIKHGIKEIRIEYFLKYED